MTRAPTTYDEWRIATMRADARLEECEREHRATHRAHKKLLAAANKANVELARKLDETTDLAEALLTENSLSAQALLLQHATISLGIAGNAVAP